MSQRTSGPSGATRVAGLIGYPARYSRSPGLHEAAYRALDIDATYVVFPVLPKYVAAAVEAVRALDLLGASVTLPHKAAVIPFLDGLAPEAGRLGAVNTIVRDGERLIGHNTDGVGFVGSLIAAQVDLRSKRCMVVGAGGAARAVIVALADAGAKELVVVNRSIERARQAAAMTSVGSVGSFDQVAGMDIVVNATPVGMQGEHGGLLPLPVDQLHAGQVVVDLVYEPLRTPLLVAATARGARAITGDGMLICQAAKQIQLWTGRQPPLAAMYKAFQ